MNAQLKMIRLLASAWVVILLAALMTWGQSIATYAQSSTLVFNKQACLATSLPNPPSLAQLAACPDALSTPMGTLVYYVIEISSVSLISQNVTVTDNLPTGFTPVGSALCFGAACPGSIGAAPNFTQFPIVAGSPVTIAIPGYFGVNGGGLVQNTASAAVDGGEKKADTHSIYVDPDKPLPGNLAISKTSNITSGSLNGGSGSITVDYTITVTNTGVSDLYLGGLLEVVDKATTLPSSSLGFNYSISNVNCVTAATIYICPDQQPGPSTGTTSNASTGVILATWQYPANDPGFLPAGGSFKIAFSVEYTLDNLIVCVWPNTVDGVRNEAFIRFANANKSFSDSTLSDNTDSVDLEIKDTGVTDICPPPEPDYLSISKVQKNPASGDVLWGMPVTYVITVTNNGPNTITNISVTDSVTMLPGMPVVGVNLVSMGCVQVTAPTTCTPAIGPSAGVNLATYYSTATFGPVIVNNLLPSASAQIEVTVLFKPLSCVSFNTKGPRQTADIARYEYKIIGKYGLIQDFGAGSTTIITDHAEVEPCTLRVKKEGPASVTFGAPFAYTVYYENYGNSSVAVGTLMDALAINSSVYSPGLTGTYNYDCSLVSGTPISNLVMSTGNVSYPITIGFQNQPQQGPRLIHNQNPYAPVIFPANTLLKCRVELKLNQPASSNPYCQGAGTPQIVNSALMDASLLFNTNQVTTPPQAYATTAANLPLCHQINTTKTIVPVNPPNWGSVVGPGDLVEVTLSLINIGDDPISGASLTDTLLPGLVPTGTFTCSPACTNTPVVSGQTVQGTFATINGNQTGTITFTATANGPTPVVYPNTVTSAYTPPPGNWYNQGSNYTGQDSVGVFKLVPVTIKKRVVNMTPQPFPLGPFPINVSCTLPSNPGLGWFYSTTVPVTIAAGSTDANVALPQNLPEGAVCTFNENSVPAGTSPYGFSAVGYAPTSGNGLSGTLTVGKDEGLIENCYGSPAAYPLQVPHVVDKDCPPLVATSGEVVFVKKVINNTPADLRGLDFVVNPNCTASPATPLSVTITEGVPVNVPAAVNSVCTPTEVSPGFTRDAFKYCEAKGLVPSWKTEISPTRATIVSGQLAAFTVVNTFDCVEGVNISISKKVSTSLGIDLSNILYDISANCSPGTSNPASVFLADGATESVVATVDSVCSPSEVLPTIPEKVEVYCKEQGLVPKWTTTVDPAGPTTITSEGQHFTVHNSLDCEKPEERVEVEIRKLVVNKTPVNLSGLVYAISPNCGPGSTPAILNLQSGQSGTAVTSVGNTCSPTEVPPLINDDMREYCTGQGGIATWITEVKPQTSTLISGAGVRISVVNTLDCVKPTPTVANLDVQKFCSFHAQLTDSMSYWQCTVRVTANAPLPPVISLSDTVLQGVGYSVTSATLTSNDPWTCTATGCTIPSGNFPSNGVSYLSGYVSVTQQSSAATTRPQNCVTASGLGANGQALVPPQTSAQVCVPIMSYPPNLSVVKTGPSQCADGQPCVFAITVTNNGAPVNQNMVLADLLGTNAGGLSNTWQLVSVNPGICSSQAFSSGFACVVNLNLGTGQSTSFSVTMTAAWPNNETGPIQNCAMLMPSAPWSQPGNSYTLPQYLEQVTWPSLNENNMSCVDVSNVLPTGQINVTKIASLNGQDLATTNFPVTVTCGSVVSNITLQNGGGAVSVPNIPYGTSCTVVEPAVTTNPCPPNHSVTWNTSYSPSGSVSITQSNPVANVQVINEAKCSPILPPGKVTVKKVVQYNNLPPLSINLNTLAFPVTGCGAPANSSIAVNTPLSIGNLSTTTPCSIVETPPTTGICPQGYSANWSVSTAPSTPILPTIAGALITVTNKLACVQNPPLGRLTVKKVVVKPQGATVANTQPFPVIVNCGTAQTGSISVNTPLSLNNLSTTAACTVTENVSALPTSGVCPQGHTVSWTASPTQTATPTVGGVLVTVTNTLTCTSPATTVPFNVTKACTPATPIAGSQQVNVNCTLTVTANGTTGLPANVTINEFMFGPPASGSSNIQITSLTSSQPWQIPSLPFNAAAASGGQGPTAVMTLPSATLVAAGGTSTINVTLKLFDAGWATESQNCVNASGGTVGSTSSTNCVQLVGFPPNILVQPDCGDGLVKLANGTCAKRPPPPPPPPALKCDRETAALKNGKCACTVRGMVPVSKTTCACPAKQELRGGRCRDIPPPPPPAPKCDLETTVAKGGKCLCRFKNAVPVSKTECGCRRGFDFVPGKGCVRQRIECPEGTVQQGQRCIPVRDEEIECPPGTVRRGDHCVRVKVKDPDLGKECPPGTIVRSGICIRIKVRGNEDEKACPEGTVKRRGRCVPIKVRDPVENNVDEKKPDEVRTDEKICTDRDGNRVPCD